MLTIIIKGDEFFNESTEEFESQDDVVLKLEHSLVSLSKWESEFEKPFLNNDKKTPEEIYGYIKAMIIDECSNEILLRLSNQNIQEINEYIDAKRSATTFGVMPEKRGKAEVITSELIYYWMVTFNIPFECETWHLNRLFALIRICNLKNSTPKKMSKNEIAMRNRELNAKRKAELQTRG
jgi:hypothetical protein